MNLPTWLEFSAKVDDVPLVATFDQLAAPSAEVCHWYVKVVGSG
jgi:hypothetical protein